MYKKVLATITATLMVITMAMAPATTAFATDGFVPDPNALNTTTTYGDTTDAKDNSTAISAGTDQVILVEGDVDATGQNSTGVQATDNAIVYVKGDVDGTANDVVTDGDATVVIGGNVVDKTSVDVKITPDNDDHKGDVAVMGTVTNDIGAAIQIDTGNNTYSSLDDILDDIPDISVYKVDGQIVSSSGGNASEALNEAVMNAINYFVLSDFAGYSLDFQDDGHEHSKSFRGVGEAPTVRLNDTFYLYTSYTEGQTIDAGENVALVRDSGNGSYEFRVITPGGGILLRKTFHIVPTSYDNEGNVETYKVVVPENTSSIVTDASSESTVVNTGYFAIVDTRSAADAPAAIAAISGDKPAHTVSLTMSTMTPSQYQAAVVNHVGNTPAGGAFNIETDTISCFDRTMISAIASRPDIEVNVVFTYQGKKMKVTIPAGYDVNKLLDENGYCGFLRLMSILGGTTL